MAAFNQPSEVELLYLLRRRVLTGKSPSPFFHEADAFSVHPAELTREYPPLTSRDGETCWYFFSSLRGKTSRDVRVCRTVASGENWHSEGRGKPISDGRGGPPVGYRKTLTFGRREGRRLVRLGWLLMEVGFPAAAGAQWRGVVLCRVYWSSRADPGLAPGPNSILGDAPTGSPTAAEGARGPSNIAAGDAPPRGSAAEGPHGATAAEGRRGSSESEVAGSASGLTHSAARATKEAWILAQVEVPGDAASLEDPVQLRLSSVRRVRAPQLSSSTKKRKASETSPGVMLLDPASAAVLWSAPSSSADNSYCPQCCDRHSS